MRSPPLRKEIAKAGCALAGIQVVGWAMPLIALIALLAVVWIGDAWGRFRDNQERPRALAAWQAIFEMDFARVLFLPDQGNQRHRAAGDFAAGFVGAIKETPLTVAGQRL